jgi:5'-3' exonuclease
MNGIIHNCTHSDKLDPTIILTNDQMMTKVLDGGI